MLLSSIFGLLLGVISLDGVTGDRLSAEAVFDANNVRVGEPLVLQIDFQGVADLSNLHPPALSKHVDAKVWKVDDASAKTDTGRFIRRLTYRVRPRGEGLLYFPALEFSYEHNQGKGRMTFATKPIPVHVKPGQQAALSGRETAAVETQAHPDGIVIRVAGELGDDEAFAWKKACANPTEEAFARFDFPEARLNEAACATLNGNWARALNIYRALEWRIGQTPQIERGLVAALASKTGGQVAELPVWRQVLRPVLRYGAVGRVAVLLAVLLALAGLFALSRRLVRALVCVAALAGVQTASAQSIFDEMDRHMQMMQQQMQQLMRTRPREELPPFRPMVSLATDKADVRVGEPFAFILAIEHPKGYTVEVTQLEFSEEYGLVSENRLERLGRGTPSNPSNVVDRLSLKARFDVPIKAAMTVRLRGTAWRGAFGQGYTAVSGPLDFEVKPLPTDNQPAEFAGAVGSGFSLRQQADRTCVATNDVVVLRRTLNYEGVMPEGKDWIGVERRPHSVSWHEYFIADGRAAVPPAEVVYYDVTTRTYQTARSAAIGLTYISVEESPAATVAVDAGARPAEESAKVLPLRFYPSARAPVIGKTTGRPIVTEERGAWLRVDDGRQAGWIRKEELP
ncbi:MAG: BatD family protein [Kiritimatiellia bacterium]